MTAKVRKKYHFILGFTNLKTRKRRTEAGSNKKGRLLIEKREKQSKQTQHYYDLHDSTHLRERWYSILIIKLF